jgi:hypothetical protein
MTKAEVSKLVAVLMACYPAMQFPPGTIAAYEQFLGELELERAQAAVAKIVRTSKFMPSIAEVVAAYESLSDRSVVPYHREFRPLPAAGAMAPSELSTAVRDFLAKAYPEPESKPQEPS